MLAELAQFHDAHPTQITAWKAQLVEKSASLFGAGSSGKQSEPEVDLKTLGHSPKAKLVVTMIEVRS